MKRLPGLIALLTFLALPGLAHAHQGNPDFRSEITSISPASLAEGIEVSVVNFDDHVRLANNSGKDVTVIGYDGEPLVRILADGTVEENLNSPSYYLNQDRYASVDLPDRADENSPPDWKQVGEGGIYEWHDHRSHYMSEGNPPQVTDESKPTKIFDYSIPIKVGGEPAKVNGTLTWAGKDSQVPVIPFVILGLAIIAAIGFWIMRRRREPAGEQVVEGKTGESEESREENEAW